MSYLDYKERSFQSDSDSDDSSNDDNIFDKNVGNKRKNITSLKCNEISKKPHFLESDDDDDDDDNELKNVNDSSNDDFQVVEISKNEEDILKEKEKELKSKALLEQISMKLKNNENNEIVDDDDDDDDDDDNNNNNDLFFLEAKKLKEAIELIKNVKNKIKKKPNLNDSRSKSPDDTFFIPTVKQAAERKTMPEMEFSINMLNDIIDFSTYKKNPENFNNNTNNTNNNPNQIKLKTRLNGSHEWKFSLSKDDTIGKLRLKFIEMYGLKKNITLKFIFDGDELNDNDTPNSLDLEDDDMFDAKIPKEFYQEAIDFKTKKTLAVPVEIPKPIPKIISSSSLSSSSSSSSSISKTKNLQEPSEIFTIQLVIHVPADVCISNKELLFDVKVFSNFTLSQIHPSIIGSRKFIDYPLYYTLNSNDVLLCMDEAISSFGKVDKDNCLHVALHSVPIHINFTLKSGLKSNQGSLKSTKIESKFKRHQKVQDIFNYVEENLNGNLGNFKLVFKIGKNKLEDCNLLISDTIINNGINIDVTKVKKI